MPANIKLNMWASQIALSGCWCAILGAIPCFFYPKSTLYAAYSIAVGALLVPFMWPARPLGPLLLLFHSQFILTGVILLGLSILMFFRVPTTMGGICWAVAAIVYFIAGFRGEKGETCESISKPQGGARE